MIEGLTTRAVRARSSIAICAVVAEAETFAFIALYGRCEEVWPRGFPRRAAPPATAASGMAHRVRR